MEAYTPILSVPAEDIIKVSSIFVVPVTRGFFVYTWMITVEAKFSMVRYDIDEK